MTSMRRPPGRRPRARRRRAAAIDHAPAWPIAAAALDGRERLAVPRHEREVRHAASLDERAFAALVALRDVPVLPVVAAEIADVGDSVRVRRALTTVGVKNR